MAEESSRIQHLGILPVGIGVREIDRILAGYCSVPDAELDFIINDDITYRMEQDAAEDAE